MGRPVFVLSMYAVFFWGLRTYYWATTYEAPFSDIGDYVYVGQNIAQHFFFGISSQLVAYWTPVTPSFIALAIFIGGEHFEMVFRVLIQAIAFAGSILLANEIVRMTGRGWLGAVWLLLLALSKPSIFWSLKL